MRQQQYTGEWKIRHMTFFERHGFWQKKQEIPAMVLFVQVRYLETSYSGGHVDSEWRTGWRMATWAETPDYIEAHAGKYL